MNILEVVLSVVTLAVPMLARLLPRTRAVNVILAVLPDVIGAFKRALETVPRAPTETYPEIPPPGGDK